MRSVLCVIDALKIISMKDSQSVQFIIMGDGPKKEEFEKYAKEKTER